MYESNPINAISNNRMVFTESVINTYSSFPTIEDEGTRATFNIATFVNCKTLPTNVTGLNGITPPDTDFKQNPGLGCYAYNSRGDTGSTIELFG